MTDLLPKIDEILKAVWYSGRNDSLGFFECLDKENWDGKILAAIKEAGLTPRGQLYRMKEGKENDNL